MREMCKGRKEAGRDGGTHPTRTMRESCRSMSHVEAVTAAHDRSWIEIMESMVGHGSRRGAWSQSRGGNQKTMWTLCREVGLDQSFPQETVEVEEGKKEAGKESDGAGSDARGAE